MKRIKNEAKILIDNGLLFEINRLVLHKFGYVLVVDTSLTDRRKVVISGLFEPDEDSDEGWLFDPESWEDGKKKYENFLEDGGQDKLDARKNSIGFEVQEDVIKEV